MKNILIVVLLFFVSCSKQDPDNIISENEKSNQVLNNFRSLSSPADKRLAYNLLLSEEKYILWKNHVAEIISKANFKEEQKNMLEVITGKLSPKVFEPGTKENLEIVNIFNKSTLKEKIFQLFSLRERTLIFSGKGLFGGEQNNYVPDEGNPCLYNPDHNGIFFNDCPQAFPTCSNTYTSCTQQTYECGAFNLYTCTRGCV